MKLAVAVDHSAEAQEEKYVVKTTRAVHAPAYEGPVGDLVDDDGVEWPSGYAQIPVASPTHRAVIRP